MDFIDRLCEILMSNVPNAMEIFKMKCSELMASVSRRIKLFPPAYLQAIHKCIHISMLLRVLALYLTWHSHSILSVLVECCNCPEASELLNNYNTKIYDAQSISNHSIPAPCSVMALDENSSHTILTTKISTNILLVTLQCINEIKLTMAEQFKVTEHSFQLLAMNKDPVIFYWMILKAIAPLICAKMQDCQGHFREKGWTELCIYPNTVFRIDGYVKVGSLAYLESQLSEK